MLPFKLVYSDDYYLPIGSHVFPAEKYRRIQERLLSYWSGVEPADFVAPQSRHRPRRFAGAYSGIRGEIADGDTQRARRVGT